MSVTLKRVLVFVVVLLVAFAVARAATFKFNEREKAIRAGCQADMQKQGITRDAARAKYPTPEIRMMSGGCLTPGQAGEIVINGKFPPGTQFVIQNDNIQVVKESLVGGTYRATATVAGGIGPQTASVLAISPTSCITASRSNAVIIWAKTEWTFDASNGWRVIARPTRDPVCGEQANGDFAYEFSFFRKGDTTAFAKREGTLHYDMYDETEPYLFRMQESTGVAGVQDMQALMQKMADPKLTDAQRQQVMKDLEKLQTDMQANIKKMTEPASLAKAEQERQNFGCETIYAKPDAAGNVKGRMRCAQKVGQLTLTGTVKVLAR